MSNTAPLITGLRQIAITVSDMTAANIFYGDVLGLSNQMQTEALSFYDLGGIRLMLGTENRDAAPSSSIILYLATPNIEKAVSHLEASTAKMLEVPTLVHSDPKTEYWVAIFEDPDGNRLAFMEERPIR